MGSGSRQISDKLPTSREYLLGEWRILCALHETWCGMKLEKGLETALRPFLNFVTRHKHKSIPWSHRFYILFTGRLPQDF